jgi:hypothetical protein
MSYLIYTVSWLLAVFIHLNNLKRSSLSSTKDAINDEVYSLLDANESDNTSLVKETTFAHKFARIESKVKEFNTLCKGELLSIKHDSFNNLFTFDTEKADQADLTTRCYDTVEYVDRTFHRKIQNKHSIFYLVRYELAGTVGTLLSIYLLIKIVNWMFNGNI